MERWISRAVFALGLVLLLLAVGSSSWATEPAVLAARAVHTRTAPLYGIVASAFVLLPAGEPAFRLGVLDALLGAALLAGVVHAVRALLPKQPPLVSLVGVVLLLVAPAFRNAAAFAGPAMLAAAGSVWLFVALLADRRTPSQRHYLHALACAAIVAGAAPWLGLAWLALVVVLRPRQWTYVIVVLGVVLALLLPRAVGDWPTPSIDLPAAPILVGVGAVGALFGAVTGLPGARWLALGILACALLGEGVAMLGLTAIAAAIVPSAVARAVTGRYVAELAAVPIVIAGLLVERAFTIDDPGDAPARLAGEVIGFAPPGPGAIVATDPTVWSAIAYAQTVAGERPDLELAPPRAGDRVAVGVMRGGGVVISDRPEFGVLDARRALPRGRGFQLLLEIPPFLPPTAPPPAHYASAIGAEQATLLALARARYEAIGGRFDLAARAVGQTSRFNAADLAILATTRPVHKAMFGFVPTFDDHRPGPWLFDLFADDLAWVAGLGQPELPPNAPLERQLHARWRALWLGANARIQELGPVAVIATAEMLHALR
jgi:hypothetical protein